MLNVPNTEYITQENVCDKLQLVHYKYILFKDIIIQFKLPDSLVLHCSKLLYLNETYAKEYLWQNVKPIV
jgi:hypothetical protein